MRVVCMPCCLVLTPFPYAARFRVWTLVQSNPVQKGAPAELEVLASPSKVRVCVVDRATIGAKIPKKTLEAGR